MKQALRDKIVKKAIQLTTKNGLQFPSTKEIASACKISQPSIYYYFRDKQELLSECAFYVATKTSKCIASVANPSDTVEEAYKAALNAVVKLIKSNTGEAKFYLLVQTSLKQFHNDEEQLKRLITLATPTENIFHRGIEEGILHKFTNMYSICFFPIYLLLLSVPEVSPEEIELFIDRLWHAVAK